MKNGRVSTGPNSEFKLAILPSGWSSFLKLMSTLYRLLCVYRSHQQRRRRGSAAAMSDRSMNEGDASSTTPVHHTSTHVRLHAREFEDEDRHDG